MKILEAPPLCKARKNIYQSILKTRWASFLALPNPAKNKAMTKKVISARLIKFPEMHRLSCFLIVWVMIVSLSRGLKSMNQMKIMKKCKIYKDYKRLWLLKSLMLILKTRIFKNSLTINQNQRFKSMIKVWLKKRGWRSFLWVLQKLWF